MLFIFNKKRAVALGIAVCNESTLTPKSPKSKKTEKVEDTPVGPQDETVFDKKLVIDPPSAKDILNNYNSYSVDRTTYRTQKSLGYVTPWNNKGYDAAYLFANKFTHISPVWLQMKKIDDEIYEVTGLHDVDKKWMEDVKEAGKARNLKMVPRIIFENWSAKDFMTLVTTEKEYAALADELTKICKKYKFDGYVLELWSQFVGRVHNELLVNIIQEIAIRLRKKNYELILVIPPMRSKTPLFDKQQYDDLYDHVSGFSLMTYDFSNIHRPGPNAPIMWIEDCVKLLAPDEEKRDKLFTGLNFYGYDFTPSGGSAIVGHDYIRLLKSYKGKLDKDEKSVEHFFEIKQDDGRHIIFYPTLYSINERIKLINDLETGVSVWELGQGLAYFFDLL
ncbi:Glycosyl hydrolases family 18 [Popillia japonica]|uniref:Chitinase domain-containing protein 1 n=1 Tax=Popillia japonica TaxID=7064 RepID=A0AAW1KML3_POPJA